MAYLSLPHHPFKAMCVFVAFVSGASISFPHLFLRSLNEVHRSFAVEHALIHPIFIHRILLYLGLDGFPSSEPILVIAPIGATFLRQRAAQLRVAPSRPRGVSSSGVPPPPSSTSTAATETSGAAVDANVPPLTASDDSNICRTLDHVLTVRRLKDKFWWTCLMRSVPCVQSWHSLDHLPFDDGWLCPLAFSHKKGEYFVGFLFSGGFFCFWLELVEF